VGVAPHIILGMSGYDLCLRILGLVWVAEGVGAGARVGSGAEVVTGCGVGDISMTLGSGRWVWVDFVAWFGEVLETGDFPVAMSRASQFNNHLIINHRSWGNEKRD